MEEAGPAECARCGDPATKICTGCKDRQASSSGYQVENTRYCSKSCQKEDWPHHKKRCLAIKNTHQAKDGDQFAKDLANRVLPDSDFLISELRKTFTFGEYQSQTSKSSEAILPAQEIQAHEYPHDEINSLQASLGKVSEIDKRDESDEAASQPSVAQDRRYLYQAGEELRWRYYIFCQDRVITMLLTGSLNGTHEMLYQYNYGPAQCTTATALLQNMPWDSHAKHALLACLVGSDYLDGLGDDIMELLKDFHVEFHTITPSLRTHPRLFIRQDRPAARDKHTIMVVLLRDNEYYALDISGMQFGIKSPVMPFDEYMETWEYYDRKEKSSELFDEYEKQRLNRFEWTDDEAEIAT